MWNSATVRSILISARVAGLRSHLGTVVAVGIWPAIITPQTRLEVMEALSSRRRDLGATVHPRLLSGIVTCALCGEPMVVTGRHSRRIYRCNWYRTTQGCGAVGILAEALETHVVDIVTTHLADEDVRRSMTDGRTDRQRSRQLTQDRNALAALAVRRFVDRDLIDAEYRAARRPLLERVARAEVERRLTKTTPTRSGEVARLDWGRLTFAQQRSLLRGTIEAIAISRASAQRPRRGIETSRVHITMR